MTYYLKYRSQTIDELDIVSVREQLEKIIASNEIPHALLFAGPKGTGKTSAARIVAKAINCENQNLCNKCDQCLSITKGTNIDVIEMDAASNRGIDDVRALRDIVKLAPAKAKAKIYIIDEAHMLTVDASNALLKTLEEPPSHVYFILATTNPEKLIDTIKSRTTIINFTKASNEETKRALLRIVKSEKIKISDEDLEKVIKISKGSFRDAVKTLEIYTKDNGFITNQKEFNADKFIDLLLVKEMDKVLSEIKEINNNGMDIDLVMESLITNLQVRLLRDKDKSLINLIELLLLTQDLKKSSPIEELPLQIAVFKWCT